MAEPTADSIDNLLHRATAHLAATPARWLTASELMVELDVNRYRLGPRMRNALKQCVDTGVLRRRPRASDPVKAMEYNGGTEP